MHLTEIEARKVTPIPEWYALFTRYQHEKPVAFALSNKGYDVFLPLYSSVRRWQDRDKQLWLPLFPSYVFIHASLDRQLQVLTTPGVIHIVGCAGRPAVVPRHQLNAVRQMMESRMRVEAYPYLLCGDRVRVKTGALMGLEGILTRKKGIARLVVSMEMLGRSAAVEIDLSNVERIGPMLVPRRASRLCASA